MKIGTLLKELRSEREITQQFVAEKTGVSRSVLSQYENNLVEPTASVVAQLAEFFEVSADYLLGLEDDLGTRVPAPMGAEYSSTERQLIEEFRKLPADSRKLILRMVGIDEAQTSRKKA